MFEESADGLWYSNEMPLESNNPIVKTAIKPVTQKSFF